MDSTPSTGSLSGSTAGTNSPETPSHFASLSLHKYDRLRLVHFPLEIQRLVRDLIRRHHPGGVQFERLYGVSYEFQLGGHPWRAGGGYSWRVLRLITKLLAALLSAGWILEASVDISRKRHDFDTLLFRQQELTPESYDWFCLSFNGRDFVTLVDPPQETESAFLSMLEHKGWLHRDNDYYDLGFKLRGDPWTAKGQEEMRARLLVLDIMQFLEAFGWTVYASVAQPSEDRHTRGDSMDTWHCRRAQN
ncbi:hypothetical protein F5Y18DRAFT_431743 [Xylariaceae sp. FL1019]|nr:hypothetical protein F5Y18DRAFT_431743 [Xylariaceae sp. FL1019]